MANTYRVSTISFLAALVGVWYQIETKNCFPLTSIFYLLFEIQAAASLLLLHLRVRALYRSTRWVWVSLLFCWLVVFFYFLGCSVYCLFIRDASAIIADFCIHFYASKELGFVLFPALGYLLLEILLFVACLWKLGWSVDMSMSGNGKGDLGQKFRVPFRRNRFGRLASRLFHGNLVYLL